MSNSYKRISVMFVCSGVSRFKHGCRISLTKAVNIYASYKWGKKNVPFSINAFCGARTRLKPGAYDSRDCRPNHGCHIEGMYVAINATATPVRLARIK